MIEKANWFSLIGFISNRKENGYLESMYTNVALFKVCDTL